MLDKITLTDFLSFGPGAHELLLRPLNVIIGPNGSGKSNLVEAFAVLHAVPGNLPVPIREGGGVDEWLWQSGTTRRAASASIDIVFGADQIARSAVRYRMSFGSEGHSFVVLDERIERTAPDPGSQKPYFYFGYEQGRPMLNHVEESSRRFLKVADIDPTQSILSQRRDPESFPEVARVGDRLKEIAIYRSWSFGPMSPIRRACGADVRNDRLLEDFSNLPSRLAVMKRDAVKKRHLIELLGEIAPGFDDIEIVPEGGQLQLYLMERDRSVPARRLSDGTLRFLCLAAILIDPGPVRLVVIEEPELGLHPDVLPTLRDLLVDASARFQVVVTTHSTQLVDAMTNHADSVVIAEKDEATTGVRRLDQADIDRWREFGSLGALWTSGHFGGNRW